MEAEERTKLQDLIESLGLTYSALFVPWSHSRNAVPNPKLSDYSLNWRVSLGTKAHGARYIVTDYMQGIAHIPRYKHESHISVDEFKSIVDSCESGLAFRPGSQFHKDKIPAPELQDVLYSLVMDADALDAGSFEEWASDIGYDTDSRKAETMYRACLDIALRLRLMIGDAKLQELRLAFQDY